VQEIIDGNSDTVLKLCGQMSPVLAEAAVMAPELFFTKTLTGRTVHLERIAGTIIRRPLE
jgi:hypothetical protein